MIGQTNKLLKNLSNNLSKSRFGQGSLNYVVSVEIFCNEAEQNINEIDLIVRILNRNAVVRHMEKTDLSELLSTVKKCFEYKGDKGAHPNQTYLLSKEFEADLDQALEQIKLLFSDNLEIFEFWLKEGHPFYPVFWDYAFLVKKHENNYILIASSSD